MQMDEKMENWQKGDTRAFETLFHQYKNLVFNTALLMTGSREQAEDVSQAVFLSMWNARSTFNPDKGKLSTWLHQITVNKCTKNRLPKMPYLSGRVRRIPPAMPATGRNPDGE